MTGVVWNSVTSHAGSSGSGVLGPGHGAFRKVGVHPASSPAPSALGHRLPEAAWPQDRHAHLWAAYWTVPSGCWGR